MYLQFVKHPGFNRLPIFRSDTQAAVSTELYVYADRPLSLTDLAHRLDISAAAIHKEVERLEEAGLVISERQGRSRLVSANEGSPFASELQSLLLRAFGPSGLCPTGACDPRPNRPSVHLRVLGPIRAGGTRSAE